MNHYSSLIEAEHLGDGKGLLTRVLGKFYTHQFIAARLASRLVQSERLLSLETIRIVDPFCGDGRLLTELMRQIRDAHSEGIPRLFISCWDIDESAVTHARKAILTTAQDLALSVDVEAVCQDTFSQDISTIPGYDVVITNPPWENLKPDRREMSSMSEQQGREYRDHLREYDRRLAEKYPLSQPNRKFAGWGTNLSRSGLELSFKLTADEGLCGIVLPASILADQSTPRLREWLVRDSEWISIDTYPAEARLFKGVDQPCIALALRRSRGNDFRPQLTRFDRSLAIVREEVLSLSDEELSKLAYSIPIENGREIIKFLLKWGNLGIVADLEDGSPSGLWLGRELDETRKEEFLKPAGKFGFVKGRMLGRYALLHQPTEFVREDVRKIPPSAAFDRVAWRDVSRRSQSRRMQAAIVKSGYVTGNSLHVGYFKDGDFARTSALLAVLNSIPFEFQIRSRLGTGHVSLGTVRQAHIPNLNDSVWIEMLQPVLDRLSTGDSDASGDVEAIVAQAYGLDKSELRILIDALGSVPVAETSRILSSQYWSKKVVESLSNKVVESDRREIDEQVVPEAVLTIPNHYSAKLSETDLAMARAVPPGGNWKDIPESIPSKRLAKIRVDFAAGLGSRSTYYGRLKPDAPAYTINTYFNRPGNGCHLHFDYAGGQHRVISQREAARLQSFPDSFEFLGSRASVSKQIGNAVPPLLAFQVAQRFSDPGYFIDLFSGAGGLSLGFSWAGWKPLIANDIDKSFLTTYSRNIHDQVLAGDIREGDIFEALVAYVRDWRLDNPDTPLLVLGGPPCQGFSTAGKSRSMDDERNHLFYEYKAVINAIQPDGFIFENVTGLLSMEKGQVFEMIKAELLEEVDSLQTWKLQAEEFGVPQRRTRVFLVGQSGPGQVVTPPKPVTELIRPNALFHTLPAAPSVEDAISDLPVIGHGEDGSHLPYSGLPRTPYQEFMRGLIGPSEYLATLE